MKKIKPGVYKNLDRTEYEKIQAINYSILKYFDQSAAHAKEAITHPKDPTKALELGGATHMAIFEPRKFYQNYAKALGIDKRTKEGKLEWAELEANNPGKTFLRDSEWYSCVGMLGSCKNHYTISQLLYGKGANEVSIIWNDAETDLLCMGRIDRLTQWHGHTCMIDVKTTTNAQEWAFGRKVSDMNWHVQAAFYMDGLETLYPTEQERRHLFIPIEKSPPYECRVFELDEEGLLEGREKYCYFLKQYKQCIETNNWPGYSDSITTLKLPHWAIGNYYEFEESEEI